MSEFDSRALTPGQIRSIERLAKAGDIGPEIAASVGCSVSTVYKLCARNGWKNGAKHMFPRTDDHIEELKRLNADGLSATQIAERMGGGLTRNAVIGKLGRLGLTSGSGRKGVPRSRKVKTAPKAAPAVPPLGETKKHRQPGLAFHGGASPAAKSRDAIPETQAIVEPAMAPDGEPFTVLTIRAGTCKWPIGDPREAGFHFCGRPAEAGAPYCRAHEARAYRIGAAAESREEKELQRMLKRARA